MHPSLFKPRGGGTRSRARALSLAAAFALLGALLPATANMVLGHTVTAVSGTVDCAGNYSITVTGDIYNGVHLWIQIGSGTPIDEGPENGSNTGSQTLGPFTGSGAIPGETIAAWPGDGSLASNGATNKLVANPSDCTPPPPPVTLTLVKAICPSYSDVPANKNPGNLDATGGHSGELNTSAQTTLTTLSDVPAACHGASGWYFNLGDGTTNAQNPPVANSNFGTVGPTNVNGQVSITLTSAELSRAMTTSGWQSGLLVSEVPQSSVASFGALRCFTDINNGDNLESIFGLNPAKTTQVYCIAFNVEAPGNLTIAKNVSGEPKDWAGATFDFTATCTNDPSSPYSVSIAYPGETAKTITGIPAGSQCTVTEDAPLPGAPGSYTWDTPQVGGSPVTIVSGQTAQVSVDNTLLPPGTIVVKKVVTNAYGGSIDPGQFSLYVNDASGNPVPNSPSPGSSTGTSYTLPVGTYSVGEVTPIPFGYQLAGITCQSQGSQEEPAGIAKLSSVESTNPVSVTLAPGETVVCTVTNEGIPPQLTVIKHVDNSRGGSAVASDFTMTVNGTDVQPSASFPGSESGTAVTMDVGQYSVSETHLANYVESTSGDCSGTLALGQSATCTITNTYTPPPPPNQGFFYFTKTVTGNLSGWTGGTFNFTVTCNGQATPVSLTFPASGGTQTSQMFGPLTPGVTCSVAEGTPPSAGSGASWSGPVFAPSSSVTIARNVNTNVGVTDTRSVTPLVATPSPKSSVTPSPAPTASVAGATGTPGPSGSVKGTTGTPSLPPTSSLPGGEGGASNGGLLLLGALGALSLVLVVSTGLRGRLLERIDR